MSYQERRDACGDVEVAVKAKKAHLLHLGKRKSSGVTEDRGVENSGRTHQMVESEVRRCHYPWEDRCGPQLRLSFTGSHLWTVPTSPARDRTFPSIHCSVHMWGQALQCMHSHTYGNIFMNETAMYSDAAVEFEVREMLEIIFLSILDLSIPAQSQT